MVAENLTRVRERIAQAAERCNRNPADVELVAVSKNMPAAMIRAAYVAGQRSFGENYMQEAVSKMQLLTDLTEIQWHAIGRLQTNKIALMLQNFSCFHCLENLRQAKALAGRLKESDRSRLRVFLQVNIASEESKGGLGVAEVESFVETVDALDAFDVSGLMAIPPLTEKPEENRRHFAALRQLSEQINSLSLRRVQVEQLSMGMSADFEVAIEEGATIVRVGSAIFGPR